MVNLFSDAVFSGALPTNHLLFQLVKTLHRAYYPSSEPFAVHHAPLLEAMHTFKYRFGNGVVDALVGSTVPHGEERTVDSILQHKSIVMPSSDSHAMRALDYQLHDTPNYDNMYMILEVARLLCKGGQLNHFSFGTVTSVVATLACDETLMVKSLEFDSTSQSWLWFGRSSFD